MKTNDSLICGDVLLLGAGKTGMATARGIYSLHNKATGTITMYAGSKVLGKTEKDELSNMGVILVEGTEHVQGHFHLCIPSPGISQFSEFYCSAKTASDIMMSEPELAWHMHPDNWIAITGTNGKTTTTTLCNQILKQAGLFSVAVGNIGNLCIDEVVHAAKDEWFVAELSSFQLATTTHFHPRVACLLNITPDHVEWHKTFQNYVDAKVKIFDNVTSSDLCIVGSDPVCIHIAESLVKRNLRVLYVSLAGDPQTQEAAFVQDGQMYVRLRNQVYELGSIHSTNLIGQHNIQNVLCASAAALEVGIDISHIIQTLITFNALPHRMEACGVLAGVRYINDSKATNVDATLQALKSFDQSAVILLCGGHDKGSSLDEFVQAVHADCKACICYGEAQARFFAALTSSQKPDELSVYKAPHMLEALQMAQQIASSGDVVLLSPACSSFDEFVGFEQRGDVFKQAVSSLEQEGSC